MATDLKSEAKKSRILSLRAKQTHLRRKFIKRISSLSDSEWYEFTYKFKKALKEDERLDPNWIEIDRYLIAIYNIFKALGFNIHGGPFPRISGIQAHFRWPLLAFDNTRAIIISDRPVYLFADLADIQPLCPLPILGLSLNSLVSAVAGPRQYEYPIRDALEAKRLSSALALGNIILSYKDLKEAISCNPIKQKYSLIAIAKRLGITSFINPPIDSVPVYGQYASSNYNLQYDIDQFIKDLQKTSEAGASIIKGDITEANPSEAINDPEYYFNELRRSKLIGRKTGRNISATPKGFTYLRSRVLPLPLGQLLKYTCLTFREEIRSEVKSAFINSLGTGQKVPTDIPKPLYMAIDEIDSFSRVNAIRQDEIQVDLPLQISEEYIKSLFHEIFGDPFMKKDWGGERNDIFSSRILVEGKRLLGAFMLKGPSVKGRLTISKCGKNGDQIQRLFKSPADAFFIQYNGEIDEAVTEEAKQKTILLKASGKPDAFFSIIDGLDTARIIMAYDEGVSI
jgi:hypothetical protein